MKRQWYTSQSLNRENLSGKTCYADQLLFNYSIHNMLILYKLVLEIRDSSISSKLFILAKDPVMSISYWSSVTIGEDLRCLVESNWKHSYDQGEIIISYRPICKGTQVKLGSRFIGRFPLTQPERSNCWMKHKTFGLWTYLTGKF
jgi:hypothetical protein